MITALSLLNVAPSAGAWIETGTITFYGKEAVSPLAQGRGLKLQAPARHRPRGRSPLAQGRGLKPVGGDLGRQKRGSPLAQGRGLKHKNVFANGSTDSRP